MNHVGIEALNFYGGPTFLSVADLFQARGLNMERMDNLMMDKKSLSLPCEDPVTNGVNAAKPIIDLLAAAEKQRIELVITTSESGIDFGKSMSTYIHDCLGLPKTCRLFEMKQACYAATAALHLAAGYIASGVSPGAKALIVATDMAHTIKESYAEPSQGVGAIAMLVSDRPDILELDFGAAGLHSYEVMDTCRPRPDFETGDADLSIMAYLDCLENSFKAYVARVEGVDFLKTFDYLAFHTPFAGMIKGAHRRMMRAHVKLKGDEIEKDFQNRVTPSLRYCTEVGNVYSATLYLALCGLIDSVSFDQPRRVGLFSYGSGCSSEFYSGIVGPQANEKMKLMDIGGKLNTRYRLSMNEYEKILALNNKLTFGINNWERDVTAYASIYEQCFVGKNTLILKKIGDNFHREYEWS